MATVTEDIIHGTRCTVGEHGLTYRRVVKVQGLSRTPASNIHWRAIKEAQRAGANYGVMHPKIPNMCCNAIDTEPVANSKTDIYVIAGYFDLSAMTIRLDGNVVRETTRFNSDGGVLFTTYKVGAPPTFVGEKNQDGVYPQSVDVPILKPGMTLDYEWYTTNTTKLRLDPRKITGSVNLRIWNGGQPRTWLCERWSPNWVRVIGQTNIYHNYASFTYRGFTPAGGGVRDSHDVMLFYRNLQTRQIPAEIDPKAGGYPNLKLGNGWKEEKIQPAFDFNQFKLPAAID